MSAGFRYTPASGSTKTHVLARPLAFDVVPGRVKNRWAVDSLDFSNREVVSISSGRMEVEATLRFNRQSQDLIDMLTYAADGLSVTYYPDLNVNTGYALWLVSPSRIDLQPLDGRWYEIRVRFRDASASGTSLEALFSPWLFRYDAGMAVPGSVFTRTGTARQIGQFGLLESVATGLPRDGHWPLVDGVRTPALLLEGARTNLVTSDIVSGWAGSATVTGSVSDPAGGTGAYNVADASAIGIDTRARSVTFTGDGTKAVTFVVREGTMPASGNQRLSLRDDSAATNRLALDISAWVDGEPTVTAATGTLLGKQLIGNGYWAIYGQAASVVAANTNSVTIVPAVTTAETGDINVYRANAFDATVPPTMPLDASGVQNAETFYAPYTHAASQLFTVYVRCVEVGAVLDDGGTSAVLRIGTGGGTVSLYKSPSVNVYGATGLTVSGGTPSTGLPVTTQPEYGEPFELRCTLTPSGRVTAGISVNGGAEVTATGADPGTPGWTFGSQLLYLNSGAGAPYVILSAKVRGGDYDIPAMRAL